MCFCSPLVPFVAREDQKFNTGATMWQEVEGSQWNGTAAANMWPALCASFAAWFDGGPQAAVSKIGTRGLWPERSARRGQGGDVGRSWRTGFKSSKGIAAKSKARVDVFRIPKRSPELNVLDYAVCKAVNRRMRAEEKSWPKSKRELATITPAACVARLCACLVPSSSQAFATCRGAASAYLRPRATISKRADIERLCMLEWGVVRRCLFQPGSLELAVRSVPWRSVADVGQ